MAAGPHGATVKVNIDPDYSQTEYSNPTSGTFQFDPYNVANDPARGGVPGTHVNNPAGYKPVICYKCHTVFSGSALATIAPEVIRQSRVMAEAGSALILGMLAAKLVHHAYKARQHALARLQVIAELNHHVRNAVFPLCLAVQHTGDVEAQRLANEAVERINIAMKEAATDIYAMRINYGSTPRPEIVPEQRIA